MHFCFQDNKYSVDDTSTHDKTSVRSSVKSIQTSILPTTRMHGDTPDGAKDSVQVRSIHMAEQERAGFSPPGMKVAFSRKQPPRANDGAQDSQVKRDDGADIPTTVKSSVWAVLCQR